MFKDMEGVGDREGMVQVFMTGWGERDPVVLKHFDNYLKQENEGNLHNKVLLNKIMKIAK